MTNGSIDTLDGLFLASQMEKVAPAMTMNAPLQTIHLAGRLARSEKNRDAVFMNEGLVSTGNTYSYTRVRHAHEYVTAIMRSRYTSADIRSGAAKVGLKSVPSSVVATKLKPPGRRSVTVSNLIGRHRSKPGGRKAVRTTRILPMRIVPTIRCGSRLQPRGRP